MFRSGKKPKFSFNLTINDLSNIPHTSGYCYLKIQITDGSLAGLMASISHFRPFSLEVDDSDNSETSKTSDSNSLSSRSSRTISLRTSNFRIHNFKCHFNLDVACNLRFPYKRKDNMIGDKYLTIKVYYAAEKSSKLEHPVQLGSVKLNLAEYLNFDESVTAKYLLQESKINSILSLTTKLKELPSDFEFKTELKIDESKLSQANSSSMLMASKQTDSNTRLFNVPQFQRKKVFGGLDGVMSTPTNVSGRDVPTQDDSHAKEQALQQSSEELRRQDLGSHSLENVMVDPIIGNLYRRVLESTWDPDLHALLKLTPEKVVHDLFLTSEYNEDMEKNLEFYRSLTADYDDESSQNKTGLLLESKVRENFKSWSVSWA
ncbi:hypothetical protein PUMCH_003860 [Australozyma saopauloensis]|uniref:C2 NT-type domain-containing protein n=1 Tax=Australozyma saopauloensis TaxID=291208 RepID=A0AAX4HFT6_9ASCO|nr:hypothetical protein PUMCH_003860 [[Candida] saopauloensis]